MNLYLISQTENHNYDTYDSAVVAAVSEASARNKHPSGGRVWSASSWCSSPKKVTVQLLGTADPAIKAGVICASFNAG